MVDLKKVKTEHWILLGIFLVVIGLRLYFAFQTSYFNIEGETYFNLRQIEHIRETGKPLFQDSLSYSGRTFIFSPVFHYIVAFFALIMPVDMAAKIVPNILAATIILLTYLIIKEITQNWKAALIASLASGFIPIFFSNTINTISEYTLIIPLFFLSVYFFIKINEQKKYVYYTTASMSLLVLVHSVSVILLAGLLVYLFLLKIEKIKIIRKETELVLFITLLTLWFYLITYKEAFLAHGPSIIWQNVPTTVLNTYFSNINMMAAIFTIGIVPFICGLYVIYHSFFGGRIKENFLLIAITIVVSTMLWLKLIKLESGLYLLGALLVLLFGHYCKRVIVYVDKTKAAKQKPVFLLGLLLLLIATSASGSLVYANQEIKNSLSGEEHSALEWVNQNTETGAVILATIGEGHIISAVAQRKNVIDGHFLTIKNVNEIADDVHEIFTTPLTTKAIQLMNKYEVKYIYFSKRAEQEYGIKNLAYAEQGCFEKVYGNKDATIYKPVCEIRELKV